ncbi:MAG: 2-amino-4-hydroxy-6-hydroxymethyldihydropteridine diphosphokinase [Acutalibacteraceae bacterium]
MKAVIGIGTNIGDKVKNIEEAIEALNLIPNINVIRRAGIYETDPWGYTEQDVFYNTVVEVETNRTPEMLLGACLGIEAGMGRVRVFKNGPRIIDLDLLVYEGFSSNTEDLTLPHKYIGERDFVLIPLKELYDDMNVLGISYKNSYENILKISTARKIEKS